MITDGYTQYGQFDSRRFAYRPALYLERLEIKRGFVTQDVCESFLRRHVVWTETDIRTWSDTEQNVLFKICAGMLGPEKGGDWEPKWEQRDAQNLMEGVVLAGLYPQFANRSCADCKKWWYDDETGKVCERGGQRLERPENTVLLCETMEGCPKGTPEQPKGLSTKNRMAYRHYLECTAVGCFPDDPIVRNNARIIRKALVEVERRRGR